jgi:hypothetical protein
LAEREEISRGLAAETRCGRSLGGLVGRALDGVAGGRPQRWPATEAGLDTERWRPTAWPRSTRYLMLVGLPDGHRAELVADALAGVITRCRGS